MSKNIANVQEVVDHTDCEECVHDYMFLMKDKYHAFYMPVDEVFVAMQLAANEHIIPSLSEDWMFAMQNAGYTIVDDD